MRKEFQVHLLNDAGIEQANAMGEIFSDTLQKIEEIIQPGLELSIVITKLQEAAFYAKRAIALKPFTQK
jgi:hypothetical protein